MGDGRHFDRQGGSGPTDVVVYTSSYATVAVAVGGGPGPPRAILVRAGQHDSVVIEAAKQVGPGDRRYLDHYILVRRPEVGVCVGCKKDANMPCRQCARAL